MWNETQHTKPRQHNLEVRRTKIKKREIKFNDWNANNEELEGPRNAKKKYMNSTDVDNTASLDEQ